MISKAKRIVKPPRCSYNLGILGELYTAVEMGMMGFIVQTLPENHPGIDLLTENPVSGERRGIQVKSRIRQDHLTRSGATFFDSKKYNREKMLATCKELNCEPWLAVYIWEREVMKWFLCSLSHYDTHYKTGAKQEEWLMSHKRQEQYLKDPAVRVHIHREEIAK